MAVLFLENQNSNEYRQDVDKNLLELLSVNLSYTVYRELGDKGFIFKPKAGPQQNLNPLFSQTPQSISLSGEIQTLDLTSTRMLNNPQTLKSFMELAFSDPNSKRMLIIFGHGEGPKGLRNYNLGGLSKTISDALISRPGQKPLDIFWMDSCLMGNLEVAFQFRDFSKFYISSQETEFTSGAPFGSLSNISKLEARDTSISLAKEFAKSYSKTQQGLQSDSVGVSPTTVSVVDLDNLDIEDFKSLNQALKELTPAQKTNLASRISKASMESTNLVDLGVFLSLAQKFIKDPDIGQLRKTLGLRSKKSRVTNPPIHLRPSSLREFLVFGYNNWSHGDESDTDTLAKLPPELTPQGFVKGPNGKNFPYRKVRKELFTSPFAVGLDQFDYYFVKKLTDVPEQVYLKKRPGDLIEQENARGPIVFQSYTQGTGSKAERYSGLSILNPFGPLPSLDYLSLDFFKSTRWSK